MLVLTVIVTFVSLVKLSVRGMDETEPDHVVPLRLAAERVTSSSASDEHAAQKQRAKAAKSAISAL